MQTCHYQLDKPTMRDAIMLDELFQIALQRYAHANGSSAAVAAQAIEALVRTGWLAFAEATTGATTPAAGSPNASREGQQK